MVPGQSDSASEWSIVYDSVFVVWRPNEQSDIFKSKDLGAGRRNKIVVSVFQETNKAVSVGSESSLHPRNCTTKNNNKENQYALRSPKRKVGKKLLPRETD